MMLPPPEEEAQVLSQAVLHNGNEAPGPWAGVTETRVGTGKFPARILSRDKTQAGAQEQSCSHWDRGRMQEGSRPFAGIPREKFKPGL